jgi:hypothetical protein
LITIVCHLNLNFGDLLNYPIFQHYVKGVKYRVIPWQALGDIDEVYLGIGTLPGFHLPREWFEGKKVTLLGTGTRYFDDEWGGLNWNGFVRGSLSEKKLGLPGIGDLGLLSDRVFTRPKQREDYTLVELDHLWINGVTPTVRDVPNPQMMQTVRAVATIGTYGIFRLIAGARYVVTDRLHFAITAESVGVPWVIYDHNQGGLPAVPHKFKDWTSTIGKEKFIIYDLDDTGIVEENTDFEKSSKRKYELEKALYENIFGL